MFGTDQSLNQAEIAVNVYARIRKWTKRLIGLHNLSDVLAAVNGTGQYVDALHETHLELVTDV